MLNYKHSFLLVVLAVVLCCCKGPFYAFNPATDISSNLWGDTAKLLLLEGGTVKITGIKKVFVYRAKLVERLVEQNGVSNYLLQNDSSKKVGLGLAALGYSHQLYLLVFYLLPEEKSVAIYLSTSYNIKGDCIGIGPAYIGEISDGEIEGNVFQTTRALTIKNENNHFVFSLPKKKTDDGIRFVANGSLIPDESESSIGKGFRFTKIIQGGGNKISGDGKRLVFHPDEIFKDTSALAFYLERVITISKIVIAVNSRFYLK